MKYSRWCSVVEQSFASFIVYIHYNSIIQLYFLYLSYALERNKAVGAGTYTEIGSHFVPLMVVLRLYSGSHFKATIFLYISNHFMCVTGPYPESTEGQFLWVEFFTGSENRIGPDRQGDRVQTYSSTPKWILIWLSWIKCRIFVWFIAFHSSVMSNN